MLNKHIKKLATLTLSSLLIGAVHAEVFKIDVQVTAQKDQNLLTIKQNQELSFPEITVAQSTKEGATCAANGNANSVGFDGQTSSNANSLCPRLKGTLAQFQITGLPSSRIHVAVTATDQIKNGLEFTINGSANQQTLNTAGQYSRNVVGSLKLVDYDTVKTEVTTFEYEVVAYYT